MGLERLKVIIPIAGKKDCRSESHSLEIIEIKELVNTFVRLESNLIPKM